jgi:hypothetical protein
MVRPRVIIETLSDAPCIVETDDCPKAVEVALLAPDGSPPGSTLGFWRSVAERWPLCYSRHG